MSEREVDAGKPIPDRRRRSEIVVAIRLTVRFWIDARVLRPQRRQVAAAQNELRRATTEILVDEGVRRVERDRDFAQLDEVVLLEDAPPRVAQRAGRRGDGGGLLVQRAALLVDRGAVRGRDA